MQGLDLLLPLLLSPKLGRRLLLQVLLLLLPRQFGG
jgi:hypothetical protein